MLISREKKMDEEVGKSKLDLKKEGRQASILNQSNVKRERRVSKEYLAYTNAGWEA